MGILLSSVWDAIYNTFTNIFTNIGAAIKNNSIVAIITFAILLALIVYRTIRNRHTTEVKTYKAISKINDYLAKNPFITEENLVEFNRLMMQAPKTIRFQWQRYIINRDKKPSEFINEENCITRPMRTNSYKAGLKNFLISSLILCSFSVIFLVASHINLDTKVGTILLSLTTPLMTLFASLIYMLFGNILYNAIMADLYFSFTNFEKNLDRAVVDMPEAIDYEIIFTPKEIQNGIPALQEFLEQRALYEQEQIQKAKESEVEHEVYNFDALGVNGSLVMQRALKESELYLGNRRRLLAEIEAIQTEKSSIQKDFDEENKTYQRNLRDIREEISSLKAKIETVTNEITRSSLRRQQVAEVEKEQNIEKDIEKATNKFNERIEKLNVEIEKKRKEIEESKLNAEKSLTDEFKHFTDKTYKDIKKVAEKEVQDKVASIINEKNKLAIVLEEKDKMMAEKLALYEDKAGDYDNLEAEIKENHFVIDDLKNQISNLSEDVDLKNQEIFEVRQELESRKREILKKDEMIEGFKKKKAVEIYRYFDANGNEFYFDENENPYYLNENGEAVYYDNAQETVEVENEEIQPVEEEFEYVEEPAEVVEPTESVEEPIEEVKEVEKPKKAKTKKTNKNSDVKVEDNKEQPEEGYKGIQDTLNKLVKAAEDKMKVDAKIKKSNSSTTKKSTSAKANSTTKSKTTSAKAKSTKTTSNKKTSTTKTKNKK